MPHARRLRDRRRQDHARLPAAGQARDPRGRTGVERRPRRRGRAAGVLLSHRAHARGRRTHSTSIAFPAISTGIYRFPPDLAARIAVGTVVAGDFRRSRRAETASCSAASPKVPPIITSRRWATSGWRSNRRLRCRLNIEADDPAFEPRLRRRIAREHQRIVARHDVPFGEAASLLQRADSLPAPRRRCRQSGTRARPR